MNEIKCPKCGEKFSIDETQYASIVKQVKDKEFTTINKTGTWKRVQQRTN